MLNQLIRYEPAIRLIRQKGYRNICEVGSGQNGICKFIQNQVVGVDIDFRDYRSDGQVEINSNIIPICGDILKGTRFANGEYDLVICVDMLEHIQRRDRRTAINEVLRIGKNAYIALPVGEDALKCDRWLGTFLKRRRKNIPGWLSEHLNIDFPEEGEVEQILNSHHNINYQVLSNDNILFHKVEVR